MDIQVLDHRLTVCKVKSFDSDLLNTASFCFTAMTGEENSLVCLTEKTPRETIAREDGWRALKLCGQLDFSLIGILARIAQLLAEKGISIFALSTYNTDYILIKEDKLSAGAQVLSDNGYNILPGEQV